MDGLLIALVFAAGSVLGVAVAWFALRAKATAADAQLRAEAERARADAATARAEAAGGRTDAAKADIEIERARGDVAMARHDAAVARAEAAHAREEAADARAETAVVEAQVAKADAERGAAVQRAAELAADRESLLTQFKVLSTEALERQGQSADASAEQRLKATEQIMGPMRASLDRFEARLTEVEKERAAIAADLKAQVQAVQLTGDQLRRETSALTTALRKPHVRGAWGELQLKRVVELSGMVEHCDFVEQSTTTTDSRIIRPDLKVTLTQGKFVYVDAKVPLSAFLDAQEASEAADRDKALGLFAKNVRGHVDALSGKQYWKADTDTPEFTVLFMPSEALLAEALQLTPDLLDYGARKNIILATPSTLIAMLRAVAYGWTQASLAESAREVTLLGQELYDRLATMGSHFDKVGRGLVSSVRAYNSAVASLEGRVMVTARRFRDLKVSSEELVEVSQVQETVRQIAAPELVEDAAGVSPMIGRSRKDGPEAELLARPIPELEELTDVRGPATQRSRTETA